MPVILPPHFMAVAFHHTGGNVTGEMVNTCAFDVTLSDLADPQATLDSLSNAWASGPQSLHANVIQYVKATAMYRQPDNNEVALESLAGAIGGSAGTDVMPLNVSVIVAKYTGLAGRKFRGRFLFGGAALSIASGGDPNQLDAGAITGYDSAFATLHNGATSHGNVPVILHQIVGLAPTQILSFKTHALLGNVRKRIR